ncbi:MAG: patatin-like phospholipase family protein [Actinomycetota bacterium]|nr:patatin-like phospholipase family protein [Actinomycetota bacterium]
MQARSGLVLGGGGITGIAWEVGLLAGLAAQGVELRSADLVVGTSAGSVVGAQITSSASLQELFERQLEPPSAERAARIGPRERLAFVLAMVRARGELPGFARRVGRQAIRAGQSGALPTLDQRFAAIRSRLPSVQWPDRDLLVCVVDAESGEFRTFGRRDGVGLVDAVAASCAVPLVYPPVPIAGRLYIDGGIRSGANADVARGCSQVIALTPMAQAPGPIPSTASQLDRLGVPSLVVKPDAAALAAIGKNVLDPAARPGSARAGFTQAKSVAERVREVWG